MANNGMTHWTVTFQDAPEMARIRADRPRRDAHIAFVRAHPELQIGGALAMRPEQDFPGAIWNVEAASRDEVERLILRDPYYVASLRRYQITRWGRLPARDVPVA
ncbi:MULTISPECIES: YciI family protein [unclassified Phaeobacter]|uniref:YciI family protein n=1 Tax=unclassified Phaeobacter TaxID=2621772 RepID=UPI003A86826D